MSATRNDATPPRHLTLDRKFSDGVEKVYRRLKGHSGSLRRRTFPKLSWYEVSRPDCSVASCFALKVLFVDILVSVGDVVTDFAQGLSLLSRGDEQGKVFGGVTLAAAWLPGVAAAIHLVSMHRKDLGISKTVFYSVLLVALYPIVPLLAYVNVLWRRPKNLVVSDAWPDFQKAVKRARLAHAIAGGIESPVQILLQLYLILNGHLSAPWSTTSLNTFVIVTDWYSNEVSLPSTSAFSLLFSVLGFTKAILGLNVAGIYFENEAGESGVSKLGRVCERLPFFAASAVFRICSIAILLTYLNAFAFVPIGMYWVAVVTLGYRSFNLEKVPLWLVSFFSVFCPTCYTITDVTRANRANVVHLQYVSFLHQSVAASLAYVPALAAMLYVVNCVPSWEYGANVILSGEQVNANAALLVAIGGLAVGLSLLPGAGGGLKRSAARWHGDTNSKGEMATDGEKSSYAANFFRIAGCIAVLAFAILAPFFVVNWVLYPSPMLEYIVLRESISKMFIIKALALKAPSKGITVGCLLPFSKRLNDDRIGHECSPREGNAIAYVHRDQWETFLRTSMTMNYSRIVGAVVSDSVDRNRHFRPSYPTTDLRWPDKYSANFLLYAQSVDMDALAVRWRRCKFRGCDLQIFSSNSSIPRPEFECDLSERGTCLPYSGYDSDLVDKRRRLISGYQSRLTNCTWGGRPCMGYTNAAEHQDFCDGVTKEDFCYYHGPTVRYEADEFFEGEEGSKIRAIAVRSESARCLSRETVTRCVWTFPGQCMLTNGEKQAVRRRFCEITLRSRSKCILEETFFFNSTQTCETQSVEMSLDDDLMTI